MWSGNTRKIELLRVDVQQLKSIDQINQCFSARIFFQFNFPGGAKDTDLIRDLNDDSPGFPRDTGRPGAKWFLRQLDFPNASSLEVLDQRAVVMKDDINLIVRVDGVFLDRFSMHNFPYDAQHLSVKVSIKCASEGAAPVEFNTEHAALNIDMDNFAMPNVWNLNSSLRCLHTTIQPMPGRTYPGLTIDMLAERIPSYYVINVCMPMCAFVPMCAMQYCINLALIAERVQTSIAMVLVCTAYKLQVGAIVPPVSYQTLLDKYCLAQSGIVVSMVFQAGIFGVLSKDLSAEDAKAGDHACLIANAVLWVASNAYFVLRAKKMRDASRLEAESRLEVGARSLDAAQRLSGYYTGKAFAHLERKERRSSRTSVGEPGATTKVAPITTAEQNGRSHPSTAAYASASATTAGTKQAPCKEADFAGAHLVCTRTP